MIGLGNPGKQYDLTRHNAGFIALDVIASELEAQGFSSEPWKNDNKDVYSYATFRNGQTTCVLVKPQTFMNLSGKAAAKAKADFYVKQNEDLLVCIDELDIKLGSAKFTEIKYSKTHNGMSSIIETIGKGMQYLRIGIESRTTGISGEAFVLQKLTADELLELKRSIKQKFSEVLGWLQKS